MAKNAKMFTRESGNLQGRRHDDRKMLRDGAIFAKLMQRKWESESQLEALNEAKVPDEFPTSQDQTCKIPARSVGGCVCAAP